VAVIFVVIHTAFLSVVSFSGGWSGWRPITGAVAATAGACSRLVGVDAIVEGNVICLPSANLTVDPQCTAVTLLAIYGALVLAYPIAWKTRLLALAAGTVVLQVVNVVRLVGVAWASEVVADKWFYLLHDYLFEFGMVFVVMLMWMAALSIAKRTA